ncbi:MAG: hypothetical protein JO180_06355, partial [Gemmatirosa sp.]|nr:hypothetical protein [Gemmatirosa sp.]
MTGVAPTAPFAPAAPESGLAIARAVHGLVDDQYGVVAHTPNLTRDAARELCRAVSVGDPTVPVDDALSFLHIPAWGWVCTRYATERDSRGRLALVSDSVAVDAATFRALRGDPFRCMPRRGDMPTAGDGREPRELATPRFSPSTPDAEATRLAEMRRAVDEGRELRPLLAALLAGDRVLYVSPNGPLAPALLQCIVLLLPPSLRGLATFQTAATRAPLHAPRLTAADRRYAELGAVAWTRELPREAGVVDPRADAAADVLLALPAPALIAAHGVFEELAAEASSTSLLEGAERVVRYGTLVRALAAGDGAAALGALAPAAGAPDARETAALVPRVLDVLSPTALADAFAALLAERAAHGYRAARVLLDDLLRRDAADGSLDGSLDALLRAADGTRWTNDESARALRGTLAVIAARRGDGDRLVQLADADGPWPDVP